MRLDDGKPIIIVMDTNVIVHQLYQGGLIQFGDIGSKYGEAGIAARADLETWLRVNMGYVMSGNWLTPVTGEIPLSMIWAMDCHKKRYWRIEYLASELVTSALPTPTRGKNKGKVTPITYKGGRKRPTRMFEIIRDLVLNMVHESEMHMLYTPTYEADDQIATLTVVNDLLSQPYNIVIATVDNDLLGLVRDSVGWVCTENWQPRVRLDMDGVNAWRKKRNLCLVESGAELWRLKALVEGDASDKIPAVPSGETLCAIDLLNPPEEHKLWLNGVVRANHENAISHPVVLDTELGVRALEVLRQFGLEPVIRPLTVI